MILIGLGSNLPFCGLSPQETLYRAVRAIDAVAPVVGRSRFYRSPAWPDPADPEFVNAVVSVRFPTDPERLLRALHAIEAAFGRRRERRNEPRPLDLDLLAYGQLVRRYGTGAGLQLPHPGLAARDFVLAPLCDIAPDWSCPISGRTAKDMLAALTPVTAIPFAT